MEEIAGAFSGIALDPGSLGEVQLRLRNLGVEIVGQAGAEPPQSPVPPETGSNGRLEALDNPLHVYLQQIGPLPLLTREQEVEVFRRMEDAHRHIRCILLGFGFAAREHIAVAEKLLADPPRERFDRVIATSETSDRGRHLRDLRRLVRRVRLLDRQADELYAHLQNGATPRQRETFFARRRRVEQELQNTFALFHYNRRVMDEMAIIAGARSMTASASASGGSRS